MRTRCGVLLGLALLLFADSATAQNQEDLSELNAQVVQLYGAGRYAEAIAVAKKALALAERKFGPDHPSVGQSLNNLAALYHAQGRYGEAEPLYRRSLAINEKALGPDHPSVGAGLHSLAALYRAQGRYGEAEPLYRRSLAIREKALGPDHPEVGTSLNNLAELYFVQRDWQRAADYWRRSTSVIARRTQRGTQIVGQGLTGKRKSEAAQSSFSFRGLVKAAYRHAPKEQRTGGKLAQEMFTTAQWASGSEAAAALARMSARQAKGDTDLAKLVRERQDLVGEWQKRDQLRSAAVSQAPDKRDKSAEAANVTRLVAIDVRIAGIDQRLQKDFPDYAALTHPQPLSIAEVQKDLADNEALILFLDTQKWDPTPEETFIWVVTKKDSRWLHSELGREGLNKAVATLRCGLDSSNWINASYWPEKTSDEKRRKQEQIARRERCKKLLSIVVSERARLPFDLSVAHDLYDSLFGDAEALIKDKHLLIVASGALTSLPLSVLVTEQPKQAIPASYGEYKGVAWLGARQPITMLPSVASLKALRRGAERPPAPEPFIGFGNPELDGSSYCGTILVPKYCPGEEAAQTAQMTPPTSVAWLVNAVESYFRNGQADVAEVRKMCPLPDTAHELKCVAKSLGAAPEHIVLGAKATETAVKAAPLDRYRVVHFATHGLVSGETAQMAQNLAEPALVLTPPATASETDDGLLTASEITGLKLDADWVVLSACNTAGAGPDSTEALSGLARAFFYAGTRALLVSHWAVDSNAATALTSGAFDGLRQAEAVGQPLGRAEAFRRSMLQLMNDKKREWNAHPAFWAPFVVVGEGGAG